MDINTVRTFGLKPVKHFQSVAVYQCSDVMNTKGFFLVPSSEPLKKQWVLLVFFFSLEMNFLYGPNISPMTVTSNWANKELASMINLSENKSTELPSNNF